MKTLYLMRHAKAASDGGPSRDRERPLNKRGRAATPLVGAYMTAHGLAPQRILCSDAARTRETLDLLLPGLSPDIATDLRSDLYLAGVHTVLKLVRRLPDDVGTAMILGHNPGLESLADTFADRNRSDQDALTRLEQGFPTAALAVFDFDIDQWQEAGPLRGRLTDFVIPRELAEAAAN